jgi:hypothetical protein
MKNSTWNTNSLLTLVNRINEPNFTLEEQYYEFSNILIQNCQVYLDIMPTCGINEASIHVWLCNSPSKFINYGGTRKD